MPSIHCKVEECAYNKSKNCCKDEVEVRSSGCRKVENADNTACSSFCCGK